LARSYGKINRTEENGYHSYTTVFQTFIKDWLVEQNYNELQGWSLGCQSDDELLNNKMQTSTYHVSKSSQNYFNLYLCYIYILHIFIYEKFNILMES
jgi:hypothetical protein